MRNFTILLDDGTRFDGPSNQSVQTAVAESAAPDSMRALVMRPGITDSYPTTVCEIRARLSHYSWKSWERSK